MIVCHRGCLICRKESIPEPAKKTLGNNWSWWQISYNAKLNEKEVKEIRLRLIEKQKQRDIAKQYNVSENVISTIKHNTRYRGIGLI